MKLCPTTLGLIAMFLGFGQAQVTWPNAIDELEDVMFLNSGYRSRGFGAHVTPCSFSEFGVGRQTAAEWLRIGFHDMATTNAFVGTHGGIDGSIQFELNDGENIGLGFNTTLHTYANFFNSQLSIGDLIALGVYASVRTCSGPIIPMRGGRIDASIAGPAGVPQPQNGQGLFITQFTRMGFNTTDMIKMTACGHTLGGVHAGDFPNIVAPGTAPNDFQLFDETLGFDNAIATRYINGPDTDPLAVGISIAAQRNSDTAVFTADNNVTLQAMTNAATFNSMCQDILQRMIETVDPSIVTLSPIIAPYEVKPEGLQLTLLSGGATISFTGDIRVRTTARSVASVSLTYLDRTGAPGGTITTSVSGTASGFDDTFTFYGFNANLPSTTSISSFTVSVTDTSCTVETFNNNGAGFPISDSLIVQTPQSCLSNGNINVLAAVRATVTTPVNLTVTEKVPRTAGKPTVSPVPSLVSSSTTMIKGAAIGPYNIYSGSLSYNSSTGLKYGVGSGAFADTFKDATLLGTACSSVGTSIPSTTSTSTTSVQISTCSSATPTPTPTLVHKAVVGSYTFQGCYTEATNTRALSSASYYNYTGMTIEQCAGDCAGYSYFGVEYGGECYCGNVINTGSVLTALSECSFICPGNAYEYCGAGDRLEMYELTSLLSSSSVVQSTSSKTSSSSILPTSSSTISSSSSVVSSTSTIKSSSSSVVSSTSTAQSSSVSSTSTTQSSSSSVLITTSSSKTSVTSTSSSSSVTPSQSLAIKPTVAGYTFQGCYTEATSERALTGASYYDYPAMTLEECAADCMGFTYWGVEYGGECYCGNVINPGSVLATLSDCSFICPGNPYEYCGAGNRLEMYMIGTSTVTSSSTSVHTSTTSKTSTSSSVKSSSASTSTSKSVSISTSVKSSSSTQTSTSKLSSSSSLRSSTSTSSLASRGISSTSSTLSTVASSSTSTSSTLSTATSSSKSTSSTLSTVASSSTSKSSTATSSTTSSATPSQTAPAIKATIGNYSYYGCQTEGTNIRALTGAVYYNYPAMTLEMCATDCAGYKYWGVEYGGECYCGNSWNTGSVNATQSDCSFICPGNPLEYCGAGNRLSAYYLT